jgi:UDP-N-acetylmuramyl pentapeptide phosphotransferase/UDP-N-acetylglucosamine-1-phosphate transferase
VACTTWLTIFPLRSRLIRARVVDLPTARGLHEHPTPRGGGLAIFAVSILAIGTLCVVRFPSAGHTALWLAAGATGVAGVSWLDDLRSLRSGLRLGAQVAAALIGMIGAGWWMRVEMPAVGPVALGAGGVVVTLLWMVGLTNAFNFMDGIDGIAGLQAVIAGIGWALLTDSPFAGCVGLVVAAASLGFLLHNWQPARIFMGDVGSAFLGYAFAAIAVLAGRDDSRGAFVGVLLVWPFVFDTSFTLLRRLVHGENVFEAHRSHLYQRLVMAGRSHQAVALFYGGLSASGLALAALWLHSEDWGGMTSLVALPVLAFGLWGVVRFSERKQRSNRKLTPASHN